MNKERNTKVLDAGYAAMQHIVPIVNDLYPGTKVSLGGSGTITVECRHRSGVSLWVHAIPIDSDKYPARRKIEWGVGRDSGGQHMGVNEQADDAGKAILRTLGCYYPGWLASQTAFTTMQGGGDYRAARGILPMDEKPEVAIRRLRDGGESEEHLCDWQVECPACGSTYERDEFFETWEDGERIETECDECGIQFVATRTVSETIITQVAKTES